MEIGTITLISFRNHNKTTLDFDPDLTVLWGKNGSGKTSVLEAIYNLSIGKSFKTNTKKELIINTLSTLYVILQTAIPDYPIKNTGHERETYTQFTVSDFYNDLEVDDGAAETNRTEKENTQGERNKQIILF